MRRPCLSAPAAHDPAPAASSVKIFAEVLLTLLSISRNPLFLVGWLGVLVQSAVGSLLARLEAVVAGQDLIDAAPRPSSLWAGRGVSQAGPAVGPSKPKSTPVNGIGGRRGLDDTRCPLRLVQATAGPAWEANRARA